MFDRIKKIVEPRYVLLSTSTTLISALWCSIANATTFPQISGSLYLATALFLVGISIVLLQILVAVTICNDILENMSTNSVKDGIVLPTRHDSVHTELINLLQESKNKNDIYSVKVICYGTSGYGRLFDIIADYPNIQWEIMVCSPEAVFQSLDSDRKKIEEFISALTNLSNVQLSRAKFLPTMRCCIVYDLNRKPMWSCLQTYSYTSATNILSPSAIYKNSYALVGRNNNPFLLKSNAEIIENEFMRLRS